MQHYINSRIQGHAVQYCVVIHAALYSFALNYPQACADQVNACIV
jgi:hypothetical protein